jgi:hypothetical protein
MVLRAHVTGGDGAARGASDSAVGDSALAIVSSVAEELSGGEVVPGTSEAVLGSGDAGPVDMGMRGEPGPASRLDEEVGAAAWP